MNNFFSTLKQTGISQYGMSIQFEGDTVTVSVLPRSSAKDKALQSLKPITIRGHIGEVDENFFQILQKPLERTDALFRNTLAFERTLEETEQKTQQAKMKKESAIKIAASLKQLQKEKDFNPMVDHKRATDLADAVLKVDPHHKGALKVMNDMKAYESPNLFQ